MLSKLSDDELMGLLSTGDKNAFRVLFDRHSNAVFGSCMRYGAGNRALAEDIQQEVWMRVLRSCERYQKQGQFKAWLMTVTRNTSLNHLGRQLTLHDDAAEAEAGLVSDADLELDFVQKHEVEQLKKAIDSLPDAQRVVLTLWVGEDVSYDEIAAATGNTEPAVRSLLFRAKKALKGMLEKK